MISQHKFPKDFLWGASTASHQVEGNTVNQWSVWELAHAADLAATVEQRLAKNPVTAGIVHLPEWQSIKRQASEPQNYVSGDGVDHYKRYEEDFDLLQELHMNSFRFSIEWSRIQPEEGSWNAEAIAHYHAYIDSLIGRGVTPVVTLWHWTMPTWFTDKGGFEKKENLAYFDTYVTKMAEEFGDKLKYVLTLNEPNVYATFSYFMGEWPPQRKQPLLMIKVLRNLAAAHRRAYAILKKTNPALQVGIAANLTNVRPKRPYHAIDVTVTKIMDYAFNWYFINRILRQQDVCGVNYYVTEYFQGFGSKLTPHTPVNDVAWHMEPEGLYMVLTQVWRRYKKPILVVENGVADSSDRYRQWWLEQTMIAMQRAMSEGIDVRGYLHWSLLDNFEWSLGWWPKFGLIAVDREQDMRRTVKQSARWYADYILQARGGKPVKPQKEADVKSPAQPVAKSPPTQPARPTRKPHAPAAADTAQPRRAPAKTAAKRQPQRPQTHSANATKPPGSKVRLDLSRLRRRVQ